MIELRRKPMWISAYHDAIEDIRRTPFSWSAHDCAVGLAARVIEAITGEDLAAEWRGRYDDATSAYRVMRQAGFASLGDLAASFLPELAHSSEAQIGDIAVIPVDTVFGHVLGVFNGEQVAVLHEDGLGWVFRNKVERAFKVGVL